MTQKKAPEGVVETYEYDAMGNVIAAVDGEKRTYHREVNGRMGCVKAFNTIKWVRSSIIPTVPANK